MTYVSSAWDVMEHDATRSSAVSYMQPDQSYMACSLALLTTMCNVVRSLGSS